MFKDRKVLILFSFLFLMSFGLGYYIMGRSVIEDSNYIAEENLVDDNSPNIEIVKDENIITPNTFIEERMYYKECGHLINNIYLATEDMINLSKDEFVEHLYNTSSNLRLVSFSNIKVVLWGEKEQLCKDHYIIGEEDGKIALFSIGDNGDRILEKVYREYSTGILMDLDQQKLKDGIIVDSLDELSTILEDYIS